MDFIPKPRLMFLKLAFPKKVSRFFYQIYDLNGRRYDVGKATVSPSKVYPISTDNLHKGYYLINIRHQSGKKGF
ncbi:MAG: hypothetical protein CM15mP83_8820 [Flavobacteriaceae bacterium]|nr:MAG: hypothetical protein CM15mP83_8820 [Flavobacteriaceae bacterium]